MNNDLNGILVPSTDQAFPSSTPTHSYLRQAEAARRTLFHRAWNRLFRQDSVIWSHPLKLRDRENKQTLHITVSDENSGCSEQTA